MTWCCEMEALDKFIQEAQPNDFFTYYVGMSVQDTMLSREIGKKAIEYTKRGLVYLVMRRCRPPNYHFDFQHFMVRASPNPAYSLIPFAESTKVEQLNLIKGTKRNGKDKGTSEEKRKREWERYNSLR